MANHRRARPCVLEFGHDRFHGMAHMGYGYQVWLLPLKTRTFALQGIHGQQILVQPAHQIVIVQTSVNAKASGQQDVQPYRYRHAFWMGMLKSLGGDTSE